MGQVSPLSHTPHSDQKSWFEEMIEIFISDLENLPQRKLNLARCKGCFGLFVFTITIHLCRHDEVKMGRHAELFHLKSYCSVDTSAGMKCNQTFATWVKLPSSFLINVQVVMFLSCINWAMSASGKSEQ